MGIVLLSPAGHYWDVIGLLVVIILPTKRSNSFPRLRHYWTSGLLVLSVFSILYLIDLLGRDIIGLLVFLVFWLSSSRPRDQILFPDQGSYWISGIELPSLAGTLLICSIGMLLNFWYFWFSNLIPRDHTSFLGRDIIGLLAF
ncbi:hypothetical protein ZIOFF_074963 [Zingiber officinale]|uniref:Uncharacterized protein n=1 Tax=Zingiber officinale TaxID=94328 RepID=A0A8J5C513_ZINOF|nr:hypothetical protein ZIOFF_074963 [Zingiber officinale]